MKKLCFLFKICLVTISFIIFYSCEKDYSELADSNVPSKTQEYKQAVFQMGFDSSKVVDFGEYVIVEGDIMISKGELIQEGKRLKQARVSGIVSYDNQKGITVRVDNSIPSTGDDNWRSEVQSAISEYNAAPGCRLNFTYTTSATADITFLSDNGSLSNNSVALASWPSGGSPGSTIQINLDFHNDTTYTSSEKTYAAVHEIGHCIGLRHTNWYDRGESTAIGIPGTPNSGSNPDPSSVFNGGTDDLASLFNDWNGFSYYDKIALKTLYPQLAISGLTDLSGITPKEKYTWNTNASVSTGFEWSIKYSSTYESLSCTTSQLELYAKYDSFRFDGTDEEYILRVEYTSTGESAYLTLEVPDGYCLYETLGGPLP